MLYCNWDFNAQGGAFEIMTQRDIYDALESDIPRLGYLMLRQGNWNGRQLVPADWVVERTRAFEGAYEAHGAFGQYIIVMPKLDLVIAHKTRHADDGSCAVPV